MKKLAYYDSCSCFSSTWCYRNQLAIVIKFKFTPKILELMSGSYCKFADGKMEKVINFNKVIAKK